MSKYKLLGISGALRDGSFNTQLVKEAARLFDPESFTLADLRLPLYDGDLEASEGIPTAVQTLKDQIAEADALVISTPEYNGNLSGVLKNALDWISRGGPMPTVGKPTAIMAAAAGRTGGARASHSLRLCLQPFNTQLLQAPEVLIASSYEEFDDEGRLKNERYVETLPALMDGLRAQI